MKLRERSGWPVAIGALCCVGMANAYAAESTTEGGTAPTSETTQTALHAQSTLIYQGNLPFHAPYRGENSLKSKGESKDTWTVTPAAGVRLWAGSELYFNPELFQGFGLAGTHGAAGFYNGEAQKGGSSIPEASVARIFLRQVWGFGGEQEMVKDDFNQLGGPRDVSRVTLTVGKISVSDLFDDNSYAHDPSTSFFNWSIWEAGAFDYAADQKGYTWGAALELNQKNWALRSGYFLVPVFSNAQPLDTDLGKRGQFVTELETRTSFLSLPGKLRLLGWVSRANAGNYTQALALNAAGADINDAIVATRRTRTMYGFVAGAEQAMNDDLGVFARASWGDGTNEIMSFTDIDRSLTVGISLKGTAWGRPNDTFALAGAINGLSTSHRNWIAAGGLGVAIGDGQLRYREEAILETYYMIALRDPFALTMDYQFMANPAYNADRGPVSVFSARLHGQF